MLDINSTAEARLVVQESDSAKTVSLALGDEFPNVFATSRMVALMEVAAARLLRPLLKEGQLSVGVIVNIKHLAATPVNTEVRAVATYLGMDGKLYKFHVEAFDASGKIGEGEHMRAIVENERFVSGAKSRIEKAVH
jgi:predicted thioesterase